MAQEPSVERESAWERQWRERIEVWRASGQTQRAFCKTHGISPTSFSHWKVKLARREQELAQVAPAVPAFEGENAASGTLETLGWKEVRWPPEDAVAAPAGPSPSSFEIVLPWGWSVRLGPQFEAEPLRRLLSILEERSC
jgi:hypothetical protein